MDHNQNERLYYPDLLAAIRGTLSPRRLNILHQLFDHLDESGHGAVDQVRIVRSFDGTRHPQVLSGEKKRAEVEREFALAFDGAGATNNHAVTRDEFIRYYEGISAGVPYDDDYFVNVVERCWGIKEFVPKSLAATMMAGSSAGAGAGAAASSSTPLLQRVRNIFREKVRQKTVNKKSEVENLRLVFKFFDLSNSGYIDFTGFQRALQRFGMNLDQATLAALFSEFDEGSGRIDYLAFATTLYDDDTGSAAHHQFQRSQQFKASQRMAAEAARPDSRRDYLDSQSVLVSAPAAAVEARAFAAAAAQQDAAALGSTLSKRATARRTLSQKERENSVLPTVVLVAGGPGCGRHTQCARIVREFGFVYLNAAELLAAEQANVARQTGRAPAAGAAADIDATVAALSRSIQEHVHGGNLYFLVDGFPNTLPARSAWEATMASKVDVPFMIYLETAQQVMEQRLASRAKHTGRPAEQPAVLQKRFQTFARDTIPVINSYGSEGRLQVVDASPMPDQVYEQIRNIIAEL